MNEVRSHGHKNTKTLPRRLRTVEHNARDTSMKSSGTVGSPKFTMLNK